MVVSLWLTLLDDIRAQAKAGKITEALQLAQSIISFEIERAVALASIAEALPN